MGYDGFAIFLIGIVGFVKLIDCTRVQLHNQFVIFGRLLCMPVDIFSKYKFCVLKMFD